MSYARMAGSMGRRWGLRRGRALHLLKRLMLDGPAPASPYDPEPGDVPVTVATSVILLLLLLLMVLL